MDLGRKAIIILLFISCASIRNIDDLDECPLDIDIYQMMDDISNEYLINEYEIYQEYVSISSFKKDTTIEKYLVEFFSYSLTEYEELNFNTKGVWCMDELSEIDFTSNRKKKSINILSFPILNSLKNKGFIISIKRNFTSLVYLEKIDNEWVIIKDDIFSME